MDIRNYREIKENAAHSLTQAGYEPRKLTMIYSGISLGAGLILTLLGFFLTKQMDSLSGLSGMGTRTVLSGIQSTLEFGLSFATPFWQFGFVYAAIAMARRQRFGPESLLEGFRRFGSVLGLVVMQGLVLSMLASVTIYVSTLIFMATPFSAPLYELLEPLLSQPGTGALTMDNATAMAAVRTLGPMLLIFAVLFLAVALPVIYRFRMARFCVMDTPRAGAFLSLAGSVQMMRRRTAALLRMDLSFWWYYLAQLVLLAVGYCDVWLPMLGVELPFGGSGASIVFYLLYVAGTFGLTVFAKAYVDTSYAGFYDVLRTMPIERKKKKAQGQVPWDAPKE